MHFTLFTYLIRGDAALCTDHGLDGVDNQDNGNRPVRHLQGQDNDKALGITRPRHGQGQDIKTKTIATKCPRASRLIHLKLFGKSQKNKNY
jgi:hypothetical protein